MTQVRPREDRLTLAVVIMLAAFLCFTLIDSSAKWLVGFGLPALQVVFIRYAGHFVSALVAFVPTEGVGVFQSNAPGIQVWRSLFLMGGTIFNFLALIYLPLTITTAVFFAIPVVVCLLSVPMLGERIGPRRFAAVLVGFVGVLIIVQPWGAAVHWAMFLSLAALLCASMYFVLTRKIAGLDDNPTGQIITSALPTALLLPFVVSTWVWPEGITAWTLTIAIGIFGMLGHSMATVAHRFALASTLAPTVYVQIIYATLISWIIFRQPPDIWTIIGTAVIVASGLYIWLRERQLRKPATPLGPQKSVG